MTENEISCLIVDACYQIHVELGPGLLESVYEEVLCYELKSKGLNVKLVEAVDAPHIDLDMTTESKDAIEEIVAE